jgi:hypothetical protein
MGNLVQPNSKRANISVDTDVHANVMDGRLALRRAQTAPSTISQGTTPAKPDWMLVCCYMLIYLELGWIIMSVWRSLGKPLEGVKFQAA